MSRLRAAATTAASDAKISRHIPRLMDEYREMVSALPAALGDARYVDRARAELRKILGEIRVEADAKKIRFLNDKSRLSAALAVAVGGTANNVVAGAGFEPATFGL